MPCTTILVGKKASYDGSTMIARNDDSPAGRFTPKKMVVMPTQPEVYQSVISKVEIPLPKNPMRITATPNVLEGEGIWAGAGVNEENIAMSATETITSNALVQGADPLVKEGIGEEDFVLLTLPFIHSAREGVKRMGELLETYGTYEMNGMAFQDVNEIWWLETIGGHHWIACRVPDDHYVVMPNQMGMDFFDLEDAFGDQEEFMCSADLREFMSDNHLNLSFTNRFNPRLAFGSHTDSDHTYNTPRAWIIERYFNPYTFKWEGETADYKVDSDDLPWSLVPEHKITVEEVKYALSSHFQGTIYDCYGHEKAPRPLRPVGINRTDFLALIQIRPYVDKKHQAIEWITFGSNVFNTLVPLYTQVETIPDYLSNTTATVSTHNFYWVNRIIAVMADAHFQENAAHIERYQNSVMNQSHALLNALDKEDDLTLANQKIVDMLEKETDDVLLKVLDESSHKMKNAFSRSDA